uniref:Uncharacterized protein n=1 Tax=Candidatus Kentrum sp. LPFa TaxID=2126335 RepID=A0A450XRG8_9GAMM|nr:MAG: hypothetical protein BECKLPF1236A_GA0070988_1013917 [Candidatus Kentron sp. LPFa]VFK31869.1 MAG: hypothetical protein BECKLPF1236C_GA0070990_1015017 [Candidatus Kentron sp. LPFa]
MNLGTGKYFWIWFIAVSSEEVKDYGDSLLNALNMAFCWHGTITPDRYFWLPPPCLLNAETGAAESSLM